MEIKWTKDGLLNFIEEERSNNRQIKLNGDVLKGLDLTGINLSRANLERADLSGCILSGATLRGVYAKKAIFNGAVLEGADMSSVFDKSSALNQTDLTGANFRYVHAKGVQFYQANFWNTDFFESDLSYANFSHSTMDYFTNFSRCDISHSNWKGVAIGTVEFYQANIWEASNISPEICSEYIMQMRRSLNFQKSCVAV